MTTTTTMMTNDNDDEDDDEERGGSSGIGCGKQRLPARKQKGCHGAR